MKVAPIFDARELLKDRRYVIVGDVHGCYDELVELLASLQFNRETDFLISTGDLIDRGPGVRQVLEFMAGLPNALFAWGNHENKLYRLLKGNPVRVDMGLQKTLDQIPELTCPENSVARTLLRSWMEEKMHYIIQTPAGFVVHGGFDPNRPPHEQREDTCMYARYVGGKDHSDAAGDYWFKTWKAAQGGVFFGHIVLNAKESPKGPTWGLDGGCVFGGELRAWDSRDGQVHSVPAAQVYSEPHRKAEAVSVPSQLEQVTVREDYVRRGLLRSDYSDDKTLAVYTYTDACVYEGAWDDITRNSRGHVFDLRTGECVARPMSKFFNLGERPECTADQFDWTKPFRVYNKYDGWLAVLYRHNGQYKISTRGSFHSTGARLATSWLQSKPLSPSWLPDNVTLCFELLDPGHRILLKYDKPELVLLAAFDRHTGAEFSHEQLVEWGRLGEFSVAEVCDYFYASLPMLLELQGSLEQSEGFVVRFADGRRVKVKTAWYQRLAKIMSTMSPISVWDTLVEGKVPSEYLAQLPEEIRSVAEGFRITLEEQYQRRLLQVYREGRRFIDLHKGDKKQMGLNLQHLPPLIRSAVFPIRDEQTDRVHAVVKESIYPKGNVFATI